MEDNNMFDKAPDFEKIAEYIKEIKGNKSINLTEAQRKAKAAKLMSLLVQIEKNLTAVEKQLMNVWEISRRSNNTDMQRKVTEKLNRLDGVKGKLVKARLNLNFIFF